VGMTHYHNDALNTDFGTTASKDIGIPGVNIDEWTSGLASININGGFSTPLVGYSASVPWHRAETNINVVNTWTKSMGNHTIKWGADYRRLDAENRERFEGIGVYYAATSLEGQICRGQTVIVAGGGNSAGQAAMFLSQGAAGVLLVIRGNDIAKGMSDYLVKRVKACGNIEVLLNTEVRKLAGSMRLETVELENTKTGEHRVVQTPAIFSMIGARPCTEWLPPEIQRDEKGFIKTGTDLSPDDLAQLHDVLLEMAYDEPLEDRRNRHLAQPDVDAAAGLVLVADRGHRRLHGAQLGRDPVEQLGGWQLAVVADPPDARLVGGDPAEARRTAGSGRR